MKKPSRQESGTSPARDQRIVAALNLWLAPNPTITVREMAQRARLSPAQFSHLFVRTTGMLPGEFLRLLRHYRAERARAVEVVTKVAQANT
jgi:AraC-like DNA-binding protein